MSVDNTSAATSSTAPNARAIVYPKIDTFTTLEAGLRIPEKRQDEKGRFAPKRQDLPGERVRWAPSDHRPKGSAMLKVPTNLTEQGFVPIPEEFEGNPVRAIFDADRGSLMLKVVSPQPRGYFVVPARFKGFDFEPLYNYDRVQARRSNGDYVYSIPVHMKPNQAGRREFFFFLIRINGMNEANPAERATLQIDRVTVTRGKDHFRVVLEKYHDEEDNHGLIPLQIREVARLAAATPDLEDLPIAEAFDRYIDNLDRKG